MSKNVQISAKQLKALECLLSGGTNRQAAQLAGVNEKQIGRWLKQPAFSEALSSGKVELMGRINAKLLAVGLTAIDTLAETMESPNSQALAIRAADIALSKLMSIRELSEIEQRLQALEEGAKNE